MLGAMHVHRDEKSVARFFGVRALRRRVEFTPLQLRKHPRALHMNRTHLFYLGCVVDQEPNTLMDRKIVVKGGNDFFFVTIRIKCVALHRILCGVELSVLVTPRQGGV